MKDNSTWRFRSQELSKILDEASKRISPFVVATPILRSDHLNKQLGFNLHVKAECLQRTGSFKIRGALNKVLQCYRDSKPGHLLTWSSGNHGAALAEVARMLNVPATVVVPPWIPRAKVDNIRIRGGDVVFSKPDDDIPALGRALAHDLKAMVIPAYDDVSVIEGQATVTLEVLSQFAEYSEGTSPDALLCPCGGGSLLAGARLAVDQHKTRLFGVEPQNAADTKISLIENRICKDPDASATICDALRNPHPGTMTFELMKDAVQDILLVDDESVEAAMRLLFEHFKLVTEPAGAITVAAALSKSQRFHGLNVVAVVSGGNVSVETFANAIQLH
ncbi:threonine/serine dehydratase [Pandoraea sp. ISTKB]|uniref:threonine ammonia-lyase n=1 Tax=Pandoraea sp. ISTKB TaxID=1586708 RepID=UPI0008462FDA|nr:threonine/serine dehydratase [Pandoraea sp. ISTKB]ODP32956.1 hypothetical protein A9762_04595 [Pandoraea sp. ISTKB]